MRTLNKTEIVEAANAFALDRGPLNADMNKTFCNTLGGFIAPSLSDLIQSEFTFCQSL